MKKLIILVVLIGCINVSSCIGEKKNNDSSKDTVSKDNNSQSEKEAIAAAQNWLSLIDNEEYEKSWDASAKIFQNAITKENWVSTVKNVRLNTGKFLNRDIVSSNFTTSLHGMLEGKYVVIQFSATFKNKKSSIETITPIKEDDGKWRVLGYFIK